MELAIVIFFVAVGLVVLAGFSARVRIYNLPGWIKDYLVGEHAMKTAVVFFGIILYVLTRTFGPG